MLKLIKPSVLHLSELEVFKNEFKKERVTIHGGSGLERFQSLSEWIEQTDNDQFKETVREGYVCASTYLFVDDTDNTILGIVNIRHELNDLLLNYGGHIGYSIRKSKRKNGYSTVMLKLALDECKRLLIDRVLITANDDNIASWKTIEACGGVQDHSFVESSGNIVRRYWIDIK